MIQKGKSDRITSLFREQNRNLYSGQDRCLSPQLLFKTYFYSAVPNKPFPFPYSLGASQSLLPGREPFTFSSPLCLLVNSYLSFKYQRHFLKPLSASEIRLSSSITLYFFLHSNCHSYIFAWSLISVSSWDCTPHEGRDLVCLAHLWVVNHYLMNDRMNDRMNEWLSIWKW